MLVTVTKDLQDCRRKFVEFHDGGMFTPLTWLTWCNVYTIYDLITTFDYII